jgi:hypothetical protein
MKTDGKGKELIIQIIIDSSDGQIIGLSQYGRLFDIRHGFAGRGWTLHTGRELHEQVGGRLVDVEDIRHEERIEAMNVLNDVEISSENLMRLKEYFTDPANGYNTIRYTSKDTGVPEEEVKAFCVALDFGTG